MEVALHYKLFTLLTLLTMLTWFTQLTLLTLLSLLTLFILLKLLYNALQCISMYAYIYCYGRFERYWSGLGSDEQKT